LLSLLVVPAAYRLMRSAHAFRRQWPGCHNRTHRSAIDRQSQRLLGQTNCRAGRL